MVSIVQYPKFPRFPVPEYRAKGDGRSELPCAERRVFLPEVINGLGGEARNVTVAHKFGYRVFPDPLDVVREELHDCGIVYVPERPYFVCIMTKGVTQTDLMDAIQLLSRTVYGEVTSQ